MSGERQQHVAASDWERDQDLSRRAFLRKIVGSAAAAGIVGGPAIDVFALAARADAADGADGHGHGTTTRVRRWAMVIDLRRCDGCVGLGLPPQCAQACIWSRYVPDGQTWLEVFERPGDLPGSPVGYLPMVCMHCENAPCVNACPVAATFHTPEGTVLIDQERCIGCRLCMAACPYDRRFFNWGDPVQPAFVAEAPYDPRTQTPAMRGTVMKCDFCADMAEAGGLPWCVVGCPNGALWFGDLEEDVASNGARTVRLSDLLDEAGVFRYKEGLGTKPRVYYIEGHGQDAATGDGDGTFHRDRLEWPWRDLVAAEASATGEEAGHG